MLIIIGLLVINWFIGDWMLNKLSNCFPDLIIGDIEIDEEIDNYFVALDDNDRKWSLEEDRYSTENLGLQIMTKKQKSALESSEFERQ